MQVDIHLYDGLCRRAAFPIYKRFKVNRFELWMLSALVGFLASREMSIASKAEFFGFLTGNWNKSKLEGYYHGLLGKGLIGQYEYVTRPGSKSVGLSDFGVVVIRQYLASVDEIIAKHGNTTLDIVKADPTTKYRQTA